MERGLIFNIQRYSVQDGPGIRTTVFLKGCPLRCAWCHNPEGISADREIYMVESVCIGCGECRRACPQYEHAPNEDASPLPARVESCHLCGACVDACPVRARRMAGTEMTVEEVLDEVSRDSLFYESSGGGVTFSGGEPLRQFDFLLASLKACRQRGLHTAVDTCGVAPTEHLLAVAKFTDLFLYDLKMMDESAHRQYTGASNQVVLNNLRELGKVHSCIWLRVPFVQGVNDAEEEMQAAAAFASTVPGVCQVNVLPFHRIGSHKFARVGQRSPERSFQAPSDEAVRRAMGIFHEAGLAARAGG